MITRDSALGALVTADTALDRGMALEWLLRDYDVCAGAALVLRTLHNVAQYGRASDVYAVLVPSWRAVIDQVHRHSDGTACSGYLDDESDVDAQDTRWPTALHQLATPWCTGQTQQGAACSRAATEGDRCWQHIGAPLYVGPGATFVTTGGVDLPLPDAPVCNRDATGLHPPTGQPDRPEETSDMRPNDRPAIITVAVPLPEDRGTAITDNALREAEAIATQAGGIPHSRRLHFSHTELDYLDDDDAARIDARPELQPVGTSWLILTAEVHA